jgi:N-acetylglucosamine-6-phosphate deacetylase
MTRKVLTGARIFDGEVMHEDAALVLEAGRFAALLPIEQAPSENRRDLGGGILAPGLIDLQVNGGGGIMVDGAIDIAGLARMLDAHLRLGTTGLLPTLITDTAEATAHAIALGIEAAKARLQGFLGLHLEGPHLSLARKGAHDLRLIRPMGEGDLARLLDAADHLPTLMMTLAPEAVSLSQIGALAKAGIIVSLGHSDASYAEAQAAFAAGVSCVTHLFNAMSPLGHREPGIAGAALDHPVFAGIIADGIHVSPPALRIALRAKLPGTMFLVTDAMAVAGNAATEFSLGGRRVLRCEGRLTLEDGTLAGADLTLPQAVATLVREAGIAPAAALAMATSVPARAIGRYGELGRIAPGRAADIVLLSDDFELRGVWRNGKAVPLAEGSGIAAGPV